MQAKIVYIAIFVMAFVFTTGVLIVLSNNFENIFKFDFSSPGHNIVKANTQRIAGTKIDYGEIKNYIKTEFKKEKLRDSVKSLKKNKEQDTMFTALQRDIDNLKQINQKLDKSQQDLAAKEKEIQNLKSVKAAQEDSAYTKWKSEMVKIYEAMDARSAAKIIQNMPENSAKDILTSMKSKKVAKILSLVNPEIATRIMRNK